MEPILSKFAIQLILLQTALPWHIEPPSYGILNPLPVIYLTNSNGISTLEILNSPTLKWDSSKVAMEY